MKRTIIKILSLLAVPAIVVGAAACKDDIAANAGCELLDKDVYPAVEAPYEEESKAAIERWLAAQNNPLTSAQVAKEVAAELFAYACYNEEYIDKYVYFSDQSGSTRLPSGVSEATKQDYKLIIHEGEDTPGYKYHYTLRKVDNNTTFFPDSLFERGNQLRFVVQTNTLYRFAATDVHYGENEILTCTWSVDPSLDWGVSEDEPPIVKREGEKLNLEQIEEDIIQIAESGGEAVIHGNINILADDIIDSATITSSQTDDGDAIYTIVANLNAEVANADPSSSAMLKQSNDSDNCRWLTTEEGGTLRLIYQIWDNGLFKLYGLSETWQGTIVAMSGTMNSTLSVQYSYSDRDTDMTAKLAMLDEAIASRG